MSTDGARPRSGGDRKRPRIDFDMHSPAYRTDFERMTEQIQGECPIAWTDRNGGHWVAAGNREVFDLARRADLLSNDNDVTGQRRGYRGIRIPAPPHHPANTVRGGILEMDPPEQRHYRQVLNPYLSPAAVARWWPVMSEITRACLDERIENGSIDFVADLANVVPAVLTMAMIGLPLAEWSVYCEPAHALVYTVPGMPDFPRVLQDHLACRERLRQHIRQFADSPRPGLLDALITATINGAAPPEDEIVGVVELLIGGGFDTTTALTAHSLEWLSQNPAERERLRRERETLLDSATEEFLRYFTPAVGDGRTIAASCEVGGTSFEEGERLWLSWAMANRDTAVFADPHTVHLDRKGNRHASFGLGIHRCIGSNVARAAFKTMVRQVMDRMPDYVCDSGEAVHYDSTGVINGMKRLPAVFTPGRRLGPGIEETIDRLQRICDDQRLAEPVTRHRQAASLDP